MSKQETTLKQAAEAYLESLAAGGTKASTVNVYRRSLDLAIAHFGEERKVNSILVPHVGKFYASEAVNTLPSGRPRAELTVRQIKRVFRQCLEFAKEQGWISKNLPIPKAELQHARAKATPPAAGTPEPAAADAQS